LEGGWALKGERSSESSCVMLLNSSGKAVAAQWGVQKRSKTPFPSANTSKVVRVKLRKEVIALCWDRDSPSYVHFGPLRGGRRRISERVEAMGVGEKVDVSH